MFLYFKKMMFYPFFDFPFFKKKLELFSTIKNNSLFLKKTKTKKKSSTWKFFFLRF
jgi:hypothetical protein